MGDLTLEIADHVATVTLDRPPVNAITRSTMVELRDTFRTLGDDPQVRVAVFTGAGEKAFMAGVDLKTFDTDDTEADPDDPGRLPREALEAVYDCAVPVIGAVNGPALGAGLAYAAVCDLIVAAEHATFGTTEINVGLLGASAHLNLLLGRPMVRQLFLTGVPAPAAELHRLGAVNQVVPIADLAATAAELAASLAAKSPLALRLAKEALNETEFLPLKEAYRTEQGYTRRLLQHPDSTEARQAFAEKREPNWTYQPGD
ncbi:MAG TPA: enoyl-CoA hydratase-related protein [Acidimicrobiales bacterium]